MRNRYFIGVRAVRISLFSRKIKGEPGAPAEALRVQEWQREGACRFLRNTDLSPSVSHPRDHFLLKLRGV